MATVEPFATGGHGLCSPTFDKRGRLLVASSGSGEVHQVVMEGASTAMQTVFNTGGSPAALCVDVEGAVFVCDVAHQAVFRHGDDGQLAEFVKEYEAKQFKGPSAVLLDSVGNMVFCDSGPLGETTLQSPKGSIFLISADGQLLQPLVLEALADPCALALGLDERVIFVAEKMQNRLLRLVQRPTGVYHCSVFYQFSGGMGPSGVARDPQGNLYVTRYDFASVAKQGCISVISPEGKLLQEIATPAPELTGITMSPQQNALYVTEASTNTVYQIKLSA
jgi:sugar lactone lactonase YvrE